MVELQVQEELFETPIDGTWLHGFMANLGSCSVDEAGLWAVLHGLKLAWSLGNQELSLRPDSEQVVHWLSSRSVPLLQI